MVKKIVFSTALLTALMLLFTGLASAQDFVYTNDDIPFAPNTVSGFSVGAGGALTLVAGSPFLTGGTGAGGGFFATERTRAGIVGNCLFAGNTISNDVSAFSIDTTTGALTLVGSPVPAGPFPDGLGIALAPTPNGSFVMAANGGPIAVYSVAANCGISPIAGSPFPVLAGTDGIKITQNGSFLAAAEGFQYEMFSIAADGSLTSIGGFPITGGQFAAGVDSNCPSTLLYGAEANFGNNVLDGYSISSTGTLTPVPGSPFVSNLGSNSNVILLGAKPGTKPLARDKLAFVSNQISNTVTVFTVAKSGKLSAVAAFPVSGTLFPTALDTSPDGSLLYVSNFFGAVNVFSVSSKGHLTEVAGSPFTTGRGFGLLSLAGFPSRKCK